MKHPQGVLRPLSTAMDDMYTRQELYALCERELSSGSKRMRTGLLLEALRTLDPCPDAEAAPNRAYVWARVTDGIHARAKWTGKKLVSAAALVMLLLVLAGVCIAWALRVGVLTFPSLTLPWLPQVESNEAQSLVQEDLAEVRYAHCELRVREAAFDGHQLRVVYSLRDTRPGAALTQEDQDGGCIEAGRLDGLGGCDSLLVNGQRVDLDDAFQRLGDGADEMLYYLAANLPESLPIDGMMRVELPIGEPQGFQMPRKVENVCFTVDTAQGNRTARTARPVSGTWNNTRLTVKRAAFSPLHGLIEVSFTPVDERQGFGPYTFELYDTAGNAVGYEWYSAAGHPDAQTFTVTVQYIPTGEWPDKLLLAEPGDNNRPDASHRILLRLE